MIRSGTAFLFLLSLSLFLFAQRLSAQAPEERKSIHQAESEFYNAHPELVGRSVPPPLAKRQDLLKTEALSHVVYGFHPYWISDATAQGYYYSLLTHVAYFSAEADTNGNFSTTRGWTTTQVVNDARSYGLRIHLTITLFSNHDKILYNSSRRQNLVNNILTQINARSADGANIDFESMANVQALADSFRTFIYQLGTALKAAGKELVVELPAVDWSGKYFNSTFFSAVNSVVDHYFLMAYDYYWKGSTTAGPVAPLTTGTTIRHVMRSIDYYLSQGCPPSQLISGFPYYGIDWPVSSSSRMASTTGDGAGRYYNTAKTKVQSLPPTDVFFDSQYNVPWYRYDDAGQWRQTWYDDSLSLSMKYDSIKTRSIAGTGMWALGYDAPNTELWGALKRAFASKPDATHTALADFEVSVGVFTWKPTDSGSTAGVSKSSTSSRTVNVANNGLGALQVVLKDSASNSANWSVRLVAGGGNPANNQTLTASGYIGYWLKTSTAPTGAEVGLLVDDVAGGTEAAQKQNVINDGNWHLYQWDLDAAGWSSFASGNGVIDGPTVTLDALMFYAPNASPDWTLYIDDVSHNSAGPLPVTLRAFVAEVVRGGVALSWRTQTETNNYGFEIERRRVTIGQTGMSVLPDTWGNVAFIPGAGTSTSPREYSYTDEAVAPGRYAYRIKQIDNGGLFEYFGAVEVEIGVMPKAFTLAQNYPNPFNPATTISFTLGESAHAVLKVYNMLGQEVAVLFDAEAQSGQLYTTTFDASRFATGVYVYTLESGGERMSRRMVLVR